MDISQLVASVRNASPSMVADMKVEESQSRHYSVDNYQGLITNTSSSENRTEQFFEIYYSSARFAIETIMAIAAVFANMFTVVLLYRGSVKQKGTAYRILLYNLLSANTLCCILSWFANNSLLIFERHLSHLMREPEGLCRVFVSLMAAMFMSVAFATESSVTMLGFTAVQYRSVSRPLVHWSITRKKMAYTFIASSWLLIFVFGCVPFGILLGMANSQDCTMDMYTYATSIVISGATIAMALEGATYIITIVISCLLYIKLRRYGQGFWNIRFDNQIRNQKRIFATTLMLFITLVIFSIPYMVLYVLTLNTRDISSIQNSTLIHYMNILPYFKFLSDPIIYGMRMREVKESWFRLMVKCGLEKCVCSYEDCNSSSSATPRSPPPYVMHHVTFL